MSNRCGVVIATRNRADRLAMCLEGLQDQSDRGFVVVVVDDCSDEPLDKVTSDHRFDDLDITLVRLPQQSGPAAARNAGAAELDTEYIVFIDDDVRADWRLIEIHLRAMGRSRPDDPPIVSCGPFLEPADWRPTPWNKWEAVQAKQEAENLTHGVFDVTWRQFHTGNNCMPLALFNKAGGFDVSFKRAEDDELALRLDQMGCQFHFEPGAIAWHYSYRTLESWLVIPRAYAKYDVRLDRIHPGEGYLAQRKRELQARRREMRIVRAAALRCGLARPAIHGWVAIGRALFALGLVTPSMWALSAAYDLSYADALAEAEQTADRDGQTSGPGGVDDADRR